MAKLVWDKLEERIYETGTDHGVLFPADANGNYGKGVVWNGLTAVNESPSGAEANPQYADNIKYLNMYSAEDFGCTIEAFTYPQEFEICDGTAEIAPGITVGQQSRRMFGFSYRTLKGNAVAGNDYGYKLHFVYGAMASPSEKSRSTINESPEALTFSWEVTTTPVPLDGFKPFAHLSVDSTRTSTAKMAALEAIVYGTSGADARLPMPEEVLGIGGAATITEVTPVKPTQSANNVTIPTTTGVSYYIDGKVVTGTVVLTKDVIIQARPKPGYKFPDAADDDWAFVRA